MKTDTSEVDWAREQPTYRGEKPVTCNIGPQFLGDYAIQNTIRASIIGGKYSKRNVCFTILSKHVPGFLEKIVFLILTVLMMSLVQLLEAENSRSHSLLVQECS